MIFLEENLNIQSIKNSLLHSLNSTIFHGTRKLLHEAPLLFLLIKLRVSGRTSVSEVLDSAIRNWASASRQSLIIIIHKTLGPGSGQAWYRTQERCDAKQEGLQLPPCSSPPLSLSLCPSFSSPIGTMVFYDEKGVRSRVSRAETQSLPASAPIRAPRRWRWLTYALSLVFLSHPPSPSSFHFFLPASNRLSTTWLDHYQTRNRPQIYCLESARTEAPSPWLMTYRGSCSSSSSSSPRLRSITRTAFSLPTLLSRCTIIGNRQMFLQECIRVNL